ncbi:MAG TPA: CHAT domain-containing protein, partial [Gemmatimonadaceae bacterium]
MANWARVFAARAELRSKEQSFALKTLTALRDSTPPTYLGVRSVAAQFLGYLYDVGSDFVRARAAYDSALSENRTIRESNVALRAGAWLAQSEGALRGKEAGWRTRYTTLAATPRYPTDYQALYSVFDYVAVATMNDAPQLALRYSNEAIRVASRMRDSTFLTYALRRRAEAFGRIGRLDSSSADINRAVAIVRQGGKPEGLAKLVADIKLVGAHIAATSSPREAETELRDVVNTYKLDKYNKGLSKAYLYLAQARAAAGSIETARIAFDSAMSLMQRQRATIASTADRGAFLDDARSLIDTIVAFHAEHDSRDAFEFFERTRSRILLEQLAESQGQSADQGPVLPALQNRLANNDVVVSYAVLPRELLVWVITRTRFEQFRVRMSAAELEQLASDFQRSMLDARGQPDVALSGRLYRALIDSASRIQPSANLILIPDRWLHFVPFAALQDPATGRFLIRDHALSLAPSATLLLATLSRPVLHFSRATRVLAIGNPAFDQSIFQLPRLPASGEEASRIASLYAVENSLTGRDATDAALERMAPNFDVI